MFNALGFILKLSIFSMIVLILGNWLKLGDKTISDQVKTEMIHAENSEIAGKLRKWSGELTHDIRLGYKKRFRSESNDPESIMPSERQKLKNLIEELNRPNEISRASKSAL